MAMNVFRLSGDGCHVFSIAVLLYRLFVAKNAQGTIGTAIFCLHLLRDPFAQYRLTLCFLRPSSIRMGEFRSLAANT
jgi:hypothetical protein